MPPLTPSNQPNESQSTSKEGSLVEFVDTVTPQESKRRIEEAMGFMEEDRKIVWGRRRDKMLHYLRVVEHNLDYDILRFPKRA